MHKWLGIVHSDSEPGSCSDEENDIFAESNNKKQSREAQEYADNIAARTWGLSHRDKAGHAMGALALTLDKTVLFKEELGQQRRVWDCALVLSKFLAHPFYFDKDFFYGKRVLELGCGIGVPGMSAALLGATEVVLTDMEVALPWINVNIQLNHNSLKDRVRAQALMWGDHAGTFDILLCSDLIYGDVHLAESLAATIRALSHVSTVVVFVHEARFAGNQGRYFLDLMRSSHSIDEIALEALDATYRSSHIYVHVLRSLEIYA